MSAKQLRIGMTCYPTYGGSGVIATEIGMAMARRGHEVHFIAYDVPQRLDRFTENIYFHEVENYDYPLFNGPPYDIALASKMVEVATSQSLDILHVHYAIPHATSAYLARQVLGNTPLKVVTTLHGTDITLVGAKSSFLPITRFSIMASDLVTVPSQYLKDATYELLNIPTAYPLNIIPNFVDTEVYRPLECKNGNGSTCSGTLKKKPRSLGLCAKADRILVHVSNFRPVKRVLDVIRIFAEVVKSVESQLILVGDGPERSKAQDLVRELKLTNKVCFLGKQKSFIEILQNSDVFLLPSEHESFGLAALEAMSCGVPVVASNAGGIPELVVDGKTGFLREVGDIAGMAEAAAKLLIDGDVHLKMSVASRERATTEFSQSKAIDRYEALYLEASN